MPATSRSGERLSRRSDERPGRLALEVDDDEVVAGVEHLAEVVVAVAADAGLVELRVEHPAERLEDLVLALGDRRELGRSRRAPAARASASTRRASVRSDWYIDRWCSAENGSGAKAGSSGAAASARCSSAVRSPSRRALPRYAPIVSDASCGRLDVGQLDAGSSAAAAARSPRRASTSLEVAAQRVERVRPGVALVGDVLLQDRRASTASPSVAVLEPAGERRRCARTSSCSVRKRPISSSGLTPLSSWRNSFSISCVAVRDRGVALLGAEQRRRRASRRRRRRSTGGRVAGDLRRCRACSRRRRRIASQERRVERRPTKTAS